MSEKSATEIEEKRGYLSSMRMTRSMYSELNDCSLTCAWRVLRKHCLPLVLGPEYCPVPDIEVSQYFDMNAVFAVLSKARLKELFGESQHQYRYVAKLRDLLKFNSDRDRDVVRLKAAMYDVDGHVRYDGSFQMDVHMTRDGVQKQLYARAAKMRTIASDLTWDVSDDAVVVYVDRRPTMLDNSIKQIIVVNRVVVAYDLCIRYGCGTANEDEDEVREWSAVGPIPVAFRAAKFKVKKKDGRLVRLDDVSVSELFDDDRWIFLAGRPLQCAILDAYLEDGFSENIVMDSNIANNNGDDDNRL